jgi:hypothetical protein
MYLQIILYMLFFKLQFFICSGKKMKKAGRPLTNQDGAKKLVSVRLPLWIITWLQCQDMSQAILIEEALNKIYNIKN